jgi:hypothetical protein
MCNDETSTVESDPSLGVKWWGNALRLRAWAKLAVELKIRDARNRSLVYLSLLHNHYGTKHDDEHR